MPYTKHIEEIKNISGCTTTKIKRGNTILCNVYATQKFNQAKLAECIRLLGMNEESKQFILEAMREKASISDDFTPEEAKEFYHAFEALITL